jgi:hypothetical protein
LGGCETDEENSCFSLSRNEDFEKNARIKERNIMDLKEQNGRK